jgi:hypothetical protein
MRADVSAVSGSEQTPPFLDVIIAPTTLISLAPVSGRGFFWTPPESRSIA